MPEVHKTALIDGNAEIGKNVEIGPFAIIHGNVKIGQNTTIGAYCEIGVSPKQETSVPLIIGEDSHIRSHSIFYLGSKFGNRLITGHRVTVRENTTAGENLQLGTLCDIQGECSFGNFVRLHSNVHVGQFTNIDDFVWVFPYVVFTNDPHPPSDHFLGVTVEKFAVIATHSTLLPGVTVGSGAFVGAHSLVTRDVPSETLVAGVPAKTRGESSAMIFRDGSGRFAYPWRKHFHRGYPEEIVKEWVGEFS
jgi:acetyltransferase-like isoleucine patch superfamily enzyme